MNEFKVGDLLELSEMLSHIEIPVGRYRVIAVDANTTENRIKYHYVVQHVETGYVQFFQKDSAFDKHSTKIKPIEKFEVGKKYKCIKEITNDDMYFSVFSHHVVVGETYICISLYSNDDPVLAPVSGRKKTVFEYRKRRESILEYFIDADETVDMQAIKTQILELAELTGV